MGLGMMMIMMMMMMMIIIIIIIIVLLALTFGLRALGKSLMYKRTSRGPSIEPCH
jgi:uncharacterized membrane protein